MTETKQEKFNRMQPPRLVKAVKAISLLQPLANKRDYDYTPQQVQQMVNELDAVLDTVLTRFGVTQSEEQETAPVGPQPAPGELQPGPVPSFDKRAIREAYMLIARNDPKGMKALRSVILGWGV